jgi:hypothetical protein
MTAVITKGMIWRGRGFNQPKTPRTAYPNYKKVVDCKIRWRLCNRGDDNMPLHLPEVWKMFGVLEVFKCLRSTFLIKKLGS